MDNLGSLCLIGCLFSAVVLFGLSMLPRLLGGGSLFNRTPGAGFGRGSIRPQADDPDILSRGSFGPSHGRSGRLTNRLPGRVRSVPLRGGRASRADSSRIQSRGGFGRSKD